MALLALGAGTGSPIHAALLRPDRSLDIYLFIYIAYILIPGILWSRNSGVGWLSSR